VAGAGAVFPSGATRREGAETVACESSVGIAYPERREAERGVSVAARQRRAKMEDKAAAKGAKGEAAQGGQDYGFTFCPHLAYSESKKVRTATARQLHLMKYRVYILHPSTLDRFYTGHTEKGSLRTRQHRQKHKGWSGQVDDWTEVFSTYADTREDARTMEKQIKVRGAKRFLTDSHRMSDG